MNFQYFSKKMDGALKSHRFIPLGVLTPSKTHEKFLVKITSDQLNNYFNYEIYQHFDQLVKTNS